MVNSLHHQPLKVPQHASSIAQHNQRSRVFPRRDVQSTNLWYQEHFSPHPSTPREKYPNLNSPPELPGILLSSTACESFLGLGQQKVQQASPTIRFQGSLGRAHTSITSLILTAPLCGTSHYPHVTSRERLFCSARTVEEHAEKGEERWRYMQLGFPTGPGSLSLPLPSYLLPGFFFDLLCATCDHGAFSASPAISKQDSSFEIFGAREIYSQEILYPKCSFLYLTSLLPLLSPSLPPTPRHT